MNGLRKVEIAGSTILDLLQDGQTIMAAILQGVPATARLVALESDTEKHVVTLVIEHDSFTETPDGSIPYLIPRPVPLAALASGTVH